MAKQENNFTKEELETMLKFLTTNIEKYEGEELKDIEESGDKLQQKIEDILKSIANSK